MLVTNSTGDGFSPQMNKGKKERKKKKEEKKRKEAQILGWPSEWGVSFTHTHTHTHTKQHGLYLLEKTMHPKSSQSFSVTDGLISQGCL